MQERIKYFLCRFHIESMEIDMSLNGKITPVQSPGKLLMNAEPCPFDVFRSILYDKTLAMPYKPDKPG